MPKRAKVPRKVLSVPKTKVCTKCGKRKKLEEYHALRRGKYGKATWCKACDALKGRRYRAANPEKVRLAQARCRAAKPAYYRELTRRWQARNADRVRAVRRRWHARCMQDPERRRRERARMEEYRQTHKHLPEFKAVQRRGSAKYYAANKEKAAAASAAWAARNREWRNVQQQLRRIGGF